MTLLEVTGLRAGYGAVRVLTGLDFTVDEGEVVVAHRGRQPIGDHRRGVPDHVSHQQTHGRRSVRPASATGAERSGASAAPPPDPFRPTICS